MRGILFAMLLSLEFSFGYAQKEKGLEITHLSGDAYVYTTYVDYNGSPFPSNSMYVVTPEGVVLIDTPWDTAQLGPLMDTLWKRHGKKVVMSISTHFHADRTAGLRALRSMGVRTYSSRRTNELCRERKEEQPAFYFENDTAFVIGGRRIQTFFPGEGHTVDNITIWLEEEGILFGGCLVKSIEAKGMGNIADANMNAYGHSIRRLMEKYPSRKFVVPGHQGWMGDGLGHTLELLKR